MGASGRMGSTRVIIWLIMYATVYDCLSRINGAKKLPKMRGISGVTQAQRLLTMNDQ
jgi:hypothetical protein